MKNYVISGLFLFVCFKCRSQTPHITSLDREIISVMIDKTSFPLPPPPPEDIEDTSISKDVVDSLLKVKLRVAIYPVMSNEFNSCYFDKLPKPYKELLETAKKTVYISNMDGIVSKKGLELVLADTVALKKSMEYENFDLLLNFSRIHYSSDRKLAVFELGISRSALWGGGTIFCLKKEDGSWVVDDAVATTMW